MNQIIKAVAAVAIIAGFSAVHAEDNTLKQMQKPSTGTMPAPKTPAGTPKVDDRVRETQKPGSGMDAAPKMKASGPKVDDEVAQTQKPGMAADGPEKTTKKVKKMKKAES